MYSYIIMLSTHAPASEIGPVPVPGGEAFAAGVLKPPSPPPPGAPLRERLQGLLWPLVVLLGLVGVGVLGARNVSANLAAAGMEIDFSFLWQQAGFDVSESLITYSPRDTYAYVLLVGILNTLAAAAVTLVLASTIGLVVGIAMTSSNWLVRNLARLYVELLRNLPKLLIVIALYVALVRGLPHIKAAWTGPFGAMLSNRGLALPSPVIGHGGLLLALAACLWLAGWVFWARAVKRHQDATGQRRPVALPVLLVGFALYAGLTLSGLVQIGWSVPKLTGFNVSGGIGLSLQFAALVLALSVYHGGQIGAIVEGGILATSRGQHEAALALGLSRLRTMRLIVLPQALRVITPPLGNQYSNLLKNTSIALAIGYSDLLSVVSTSVNQTFRPIELMTLVALFFLIANLLISAGVNWCNHVFRIRGR